MKYFLLLLQEANFTTRSILLPYDLLSNKRKKELEMIKNYTKYNKCNCCIPNIVYIDYFSINGESFKVLEKDKEIDGIISNYIFLAEGYGPINYINNEENYLILNNKSEENNDMIWYSISYIGVNGMVLKSSQKNDCEEYKVCDICSKNFRIVEYVEMLNLKKEFNDIKSIEIIDSCLVLQNFIEL